MRLQLLPNIWGLFVQFNEHLASVNMDKDLDQSQEHGEDETKNVGVI